MPIDTSTTPALLQQRHRARLQLKIGQRASLRADVAISTSGLLAIGGAVSSILLSTAVIVGFAKRDRTYGAGVAKDGDSRT